MSEEGTTVEPGSTEGQSSDGSGGNQTTGTETGGSERQSTDVTTEGQSTETGGSTEETFFDPHDIQDKPELMAAYKQMQSSYTKKMQKLSESDKKVQAYDRISSDPVGALQAMAQRLGYTVSRGEAQRQLNQGVDENWEPQSWNDVFNKAKEIAKAELRQEFQPILGEVQNLKKSNLSSYLDQNAPDWRMYESEMMENLQKHPTLANDPLSLYTLSIPKEVLESRATKRAIDRMKNKGESSAMSGKSTTKEKSGDFPDKPVSFEDAVKLAQEKLAKDGIKPPG